MAKFVKVWNARDKVLKLVVEATEEAEKYRVQEYQAAVKIQSWFRGIRVRAYLRYLVENVIIIQKNFRGLLGRIIYRQRLKECVQEMRDNYYNSMATRIQCMWRGYCVRRYVFNYYAYKLYMEGLARKNEIVRASLKQEAERVAEETLNREERLLEVIMEGEARRHHYMLSTCCHDGVFKSRNDQINLFEQKMKSVHFTPSKQLLTSKTATDDASIPLNDRHRMALNEQKMSPDSQGSTLPPLVQKSKVQGPFRSLDEVWRQRVKPLNPTLRVATDYNHKEIARAKLKAEEWRNRIIDNKFLPFPQLELKSQPSVLIQTPFKKPHHGTESFRGEKSASGAQEPFQTVVPSIPTFDKLNTTY